jgi:hypothetical protein
MAVYAELFDGTRLEFPDGTDPSVISATAKRVTQSLLSSQKSEATVPEVPSGQRRPEDIGFIERNIGAAKRGVEALGDITGGLGLAGTAITGTDAETAAKMREIKREQAKPQETPGLTAGDIERIYKQQGLGAAAAQVPSYITEQVLQSAPQMAGPLAAGAGATALAAPLGPAAPVVGALVGIGTYGIQQFGNFLTRQAIEKNDPRELNLTKAAMTAGATAPLGYFADRFTAGLGGLGTKKAGEEIIKELSARQVAAKVGKRAAVGASAGVIAEAPLEVLEQAAERWQAGLELTGDEAANEYKEAFFGAAAAGAGIGGTSRAIQAYQTPVKPGTTDTLQGPSEEEQRARWNELNAISKGTKDQITVDENGNQVKIPGQLGRYFTPEERAEYQQLNQKFGQKPVVPPEAPPMAAPPSESQDTQAMIDEFRGTTPPPVPPVPPAPPIEQPPIPPAPTTNVWEGIQNRDRSTPASIAQMTKIANEPDYSRVSMSRDYGTGAPIVAGSEIDPTRLGRTDTVTGSDGKKVPIQYGVIEAGEVIPSHNADGTKNSAYVDPSVPAFRAITNGRVAGLQAAYNQGTATDYRNALLNDDLHGIDKNVIEGMQNPMLVRVMPMDQVNANTGDVSNTGAGLSFNIVEQAKNDTNRLDLSTVSFTDAGDVSQQTIRDFIKAMPTTEQGNLIDKQGNPTKQAVERVDAAIFQQAYGNDKLTELAFQARDEEARNIVRALNMAASKAIRLTDAGDYDVRPLVNEAVEIAINARRNNTSLSDAAKQADMTTNPMANQIVQMFADNSRSSKAIGENLSNLFDNAYNEVSKEGADMFGEVPKRPVDQLIKDSFAKKTEPDLFAEVEKVTDPDRNPEEPKQFKSKKPIEQIAKEIEAMTDGSQVAGWLVENAPNEAAKAIADRLLVNIKAIEDSGVPIKIEVLNGSKRRNYYGASGLATGGTKNIQYFKVVFNGLNSKGQAEFEVGTKEAKEGKPTSTTPTGTRYSTLMHELLHVISQVQLDALIKRNFKGPEKVIYNELRSIYNAVKDQIESQKRDLPRSQWHPLLNEVGRKNNRSILTDIHELFVRALTEKNVQSYLSTVNMGKKTALTKLMEVFRKVIGLNPDYQSALDRIMIVSDKIFAQTPKDMQRLAQTEGYDFPTMKKQDVSEESKPLKLRSDNPGGNWLKENRAYSESKGRNGYGIPNSFGAVTGYYRRNVLVPVDVLAQVKGMRGEQQNVRDDSIKSLMDYMGKNNKLPPFSDKEPDTQHAPFIQVYQDGTPYVNEGNHRIMTAKKLGWKYLPIELRYFNGAETETGLLSPSKIAEYDKQAHDDGFNVANYSAKPETVSAKKEEPWYERDTPNRFGREIALTDFYNKMQDSYDESSSPQEAYEAAYEDATSQEKAILRQLQKENFLGFDYPHQAIQAIVQEPQNFELTAPLKAAISRLGNKVAGVTRKEAALEEEPTLKTNTPQFRKWFGKSKITNEDGSPKVMYHGTQADITEFKGKLLFVSPNQNVANKFAADDMLYGPESTLLTPGANVLPVYVKSNNPFDYKNQKQVDELFEKIKSIFAKESREDAKRLLSEGNFKLTEDSRVIDAIKSLGYDGLYVEEFGAKNLAVFEPTQIKSAIGNTGEYSTEVADIRYEEVGKDGQEKPTKEARNYLGQKVQANWAFPEDNIKHFGGISDEAIDNFIYKIQDKQIDTKRAQQAIEKAAGEIEENLNVYQKEQLYHGRTATGIREFLLNELMPAIKNLNKLKLTPQDLKEYLHNRHAEERNNKMNEVNKKDPITGKERETPWELQDRASGISTKDAREYLAKLDPQKKAALENVAKQFDNMIKKTQNILVASGAESQATIDAWNDTYEHYVPLFRIEDDFAKTGGLGATGASKGFGVRGKFSKRAMGSEKEVQDILGNLIAQRERALIRAEKLKVGKALYGLALMNPNPGFWLPVNPDAIKSKDALLEELRSLGFDDAEAIAKNLMDEPKTRYISKERKQFTDPQTGLPIEFTEESVKLKIDNLKRFGDNVFPVRIDGKDRYIFFNKNDPQAQRMVHSLMNLDADNLGTIEGIIGKVTRWFAAVNTQYNPIFGVVNLIRDVGGANVNLSTTAIAGEQAKVTRNIFPAMRGILNVLRDERKGKTDTTGKWAKAFQEFRKEGAQTGYRDSLIRTDEDKQIVEDELKKLKPGGNTKKAFKAIIGALSDFNDMMENSVRLSAYMAARDKGLSKQQAAIVAKNLTVNFDKKGQLSARVNAYYAFFNASVQGTARLAQTLRGPKGKAIIGGGIALGTMQAVMLAAAGYREDEPPEFIRERNFIIPMPDGKFVTIPYPLGLHILPNLGRITTEFVLNGGKDAGKKVASLTGAFAGAFSPIGSSGLSLQTVLPTVADPFAALESNKDAFGRPIYKKDQATNPTPGYMRSRETASEISKQISYFLNLASGGTKYSKGFLSPTADEIDYVVGQVTGGAGRELMKTEQTIKSAVTGEELPSYRIPLAGRFYGETQSNAAESQRFYNNVVKMADHENEIKGRIKNKEPVGPYLKEHPEARMWQMANTVENQINALNKQKKEFIERGLPKDRIKRIENQKATIMKRFNDQLEKYEE